MKILTSMNREIYDAYGKDMLRRCNTFLPPGIEVMVYWNGGFWPQEDDEPKFSIRFLESVKGFCDFQTYAEQYQAEQKVNTRRNAFLWNAKRFACKAFAWGDYLPDDDVIWLDADVAIFDHVPREFLESLITEQPYTYLGRDSYTETGFLAFNNSNPESYALRRKVLEIYRSRHVFDLKHWTDCHVFDAARTQLVGWGTNLSPSGKGFDHVFNESVLGRYMDHMKGPRKLKGFSPENHKSAEDRDHGLRAAQG